MSATDETLDEHEKPGIKTLLRDVSNHYRDEWRTRTWFGKVCLPFEVGTYALVLVVVAVALSPIAFLLWYCRKLEEGGTELKSLLPPIYKDER